MMSKKLIIGSVVGGLVALAATAAVVGGANAGAPTSLDDQGFDTPPGFTEPVSQATYDAKYEEFKGCMRDAGAPIFGERTVAGVYRFSYTDEGAYNGCYRAFGAYDASWQVAHAYDSPTYVSLRRCLTEVGVKPAADADGVWKQVQEHNIDPSLCTLGVPSEPSN